MTEQIESMITKLNIAESMEEMAEVENQIAEELGRGFLHGKYDYAYLMQTKEKVERTEEACRKIFEPEMIKPERRMMR